MPDWNPWHGCQKISPGCAHCYVYRRDSQHGKDASQVTKNKDFDLPLRKDRRGSYKLQPSDGIVYTCFTSDFLIEGADEWRQEAWDMINRRPDLHFLFITKRIHRFLECIPPDWGDGYKNVTVCCTAENQECADYRLPLFLSAPIRHKQIICSPLLESIDLTPYLNAKIEQVTVGGESGPEARLCDYEWVLQLRQNCIESGTPFHFQQTGARFQKNSKIYLIERRHQHQQAQRAGIDIK